MKHCLSALCLIAAITGCNKKTNDKPATTGSAAAPAPAPAPAAKQVAAAPEAPSSGDCGAGKTILAGPKICLALPDGYDKPLKLDQVKDPSHGHIQMYYQDAKYQFQGSAQITYNLSSANPVSFDLLADDAKNYCDAPPKMEDVAGGKGKYFTCPSKKLDGNTLSKAEIGTGTLTIHCDTQSKGKPELDSMCKTLVAE
ncbi:MAG: hypothetical protein QM831_31915 [Kofleriaceae bacterium]